MKILFKFFIFFAYLAFIFIIKNYYLLVALILLNMLILVNLKLNIKEFFKVIIFLIPFLMLSFICNLIWSNLENSFLILIRLILAYMVTYIFSNLTPVADIVQFVETVTKPLSIFNLNNKKAGLIVGIGISMIPILKDEIEQKRYALKSKGYTFKFNNLNIIFKPLFISILKRTGEIEKSLISKGYQE